MSRVLFRPIRGGLRESMQEVKEFDSLHSLLDYLVISSIGVGKGNFSHEDLYVSYYGFDTRIKWDTFIITSLHFGGEKFDCPQAVCGYCAFNDDAQKEWKK